MNDEKIRYTWQDAEGEWARKFLWYVDYGVDEPSRREAYKRIGAALERSPRTVESWVRGYRPYDWRSVLRVLEMDFGPPPADVWPE